METNSIVVENGWVVVIVGPVRHQVIHLGRKFQETVDVCVETEQGLIMSRKNGSPVLFHRKDLLDIVGIKNTLSYDK